MIQEKKKEIEDTLYEKNPSLKYSDAIFLFIVCMTFLLSIMLFEGWMRWVWGIMAFLSFISIIGALNK